MNTTVVPTFATKQAREAFFRVKLGGSAPWANRALVLIYAYQTEAEKQVGQTTNLNGVGFSALDSKILSSFAARVMAWNPATSPYPEPLSSKQQALVFRLMPRYAAQLISHLDAAGKLPALVKASKANAA